MDYFVEDEFLPPESAEFEQLILDLKDALRSSVKKEITDQLEQLQQENAELRVLKENYDEQMGEVEAMKRQYMRLLQKAKNEAKEAAMKELFAPVFQDAWVCKGEYRPVLPKCNKCDDKRMIHFHSPQGKAYSEPCECSRSIYVYRPVKIQVTVFGQRLSSGGKPKYRYVGYSYKTEEQNYGERIEKQVYSDRIVKTEEDYEKMGCHISDVIFLSEEAAISVCTEYNNRALAEHTKKMEELQNG